MTDILFTICNTGILIAWGALLFAPSRGFSKPLITFPWVPLVLSFFYSYFILISGGLAEADFSTLKGIVQLFQQATPESAAAGWLHYLAFDFWVGAWMVRHSQKSQIGQVYIFIPLLCTFLLGPIGILTYSLVYFFKKRIIEAR